jgi:Uma2 family endonuclease
MEASIVKEKTYTIEEYLTLEEKAKVKHYYLDGKILEMPGSTPIHNLIVTRITTELVVALDKKRIEYFVLNSDQQIHIPEYNEFVYPDAVVICEKIICYPNSNAILNPILLVEVLSPSTASYDRTGKFVKYKSITSFREYVLVRQDKPWVSASFRQKPDTWVDTLVEGLDASIYLKSIDCTLDLEKNYKGITF